MSDKKILALVVDDVNDNRDLLSMQLMNIGFDVQSACNGKQALEKIQKNVPDIIFLDIQMPVLNGLKTLRAIKYTFKDKPIICVAISAYALGKEKQQYLDSGFDDFITKPYRSEQLYQSLEVLLNIKLLQKPSDSNQTDESPYNMDYSALHLPDPIYSKLKEAAELNALMRIEKILNEMKSLGPELKEFANYLSVFFKNYDMASILETLENLANE
jgi:CheY-like chemotaxis protein